MSILLVAVNYGSYGEAIRLLSSVRVCDQAGAVTCVLVDNSPAEQRTRFADDIHVLKGLCTYILPDRNLGYFAGALFGIDAHLRQASERPQWIIISNVDVLWRTAGIEEVLSAIKYRQQNVACIAPEIRSLDGERKNPYLRGRPNRNWMRWNLALYSNFVLTNLWIASLLIIRRLWRQSDPAPEPFSLQEIYAAHGAVMIFDADFALNNRRMFTHTFLYWEENIVAEYVRANRGAVVYAPMIAFVHQGGVSTGKWKSPRMTRYLFQGAMTVWREFYAGR